MALTPDSDPTGLAAALVPVITLVALYLGKSWDAELVAVGVAGVVNAGMILLARTRAWSPASVESLRSDLQGGSMEPDVI